jgi:hypothetical protein
VKTAKALNNIWLKTFKAEVEKHKGVTHHALESIFMNHDERVCGWIDRETCKHTTLHQIDRIMGDQGVRVDINLHG